MTRIAIAVDAASGIAGHTGRCSDFAIYEIAEGAARFLERRHNPVSAPHSEHRHEHHHDGEHTHGQNCQGGHHHEGDHCEGGHHDHNAEAGDPHHEGRHQHRHHHNHQTLVEILGDCQAVISRGMGPRLVRDFAAGGLEAIITDETGIEAAAAAFAAGTLRRVRAGCCRHAHSA